MKIAEYILRFLRVFKTWFIKEFWPWFLKEVWPLIQNYVIELLRDLAKNLIHKIKEWLESRNKQRDETISSKISEAEEKAANSKDQVEIEKQIAIARVWREVAEMFRIENEELHNKLEQYQKESLDNVINKFIDTELELEEKDNKLSLSIGEEKEQIFLPNPKTFK